MLRIVAAYLVAVVAAFVVGSVFVTQFNLARVAGMGLDISTGVRLQATLHDLLGLAATYLPMVAVAFLIALLVASGLLKLFPQQRLLLFVLAGAVGLVTVHLLIKALLGLNGIAATRTLAGLLSQGLAGALGGYVFYAMRRAAGDGATD